MRLSRHLLCWLAVPLLVTACSERGASVASKAPPAPAASAPPPAAAPTAYRATLQDGIDFSKSGYPEFVAKAEGISHTEAFGRWTDGPRTVITFKEPLPRKFDLTIKGAAYGPNINQPVKVTIGSVTQDLSFNSDLNVEPQSKRLTFNLDQPADRIELLIPQPSQPPNGDVRKLGIALVELKIDPAAK
jgi:phosphoglycerol transferase